MTSCCSRGSPRGWPPARLATRTLLFSRHAQKPALHHLAGNLASSGTDESCLQHVEAAMVRVAAALTPRGSAGPRAPLPRTRWTISRGRPGRVPGRSPRTPGRGRGARRRTLPDWACVNRRERYCLWCLKGNQTLDFALLVERRKDHDGVISWVHLMPSLHIEAK